MLKRELIRFFKLTIAVSMFSIWNSAFGYDINDKLSIGGVLAGAYQYQWTDGDEDLGRGAIPFQPELSFSPTEQDEILVKFGFAAGNGLNGVTAFNLAPWAADIEDDVKDINGRNRDYLLTARYEHEFKFSEAHSLELIGGIIDATDYIDENAYANCEYTQFMNQALVNGPNGFAPSYDIGGVVEWEIGSWEITGVGMNVGENDDGENYNFFAAQIGYKLETSLGEGHYRLVGEGASKDFLNSVGEKESRAAVFLSFDQALGDIFGVWIRFGWQNDKALIDYDTLYSGGVNITGEWYGRAEDNIGIGYAYLNGDSDNEFDDTRVAEIYWRFVLNEFFAATTDFQYMKDKYKTGMDDIDGYILGVRGTVEF